MLMPISGSYTDLGAWRTSSSLGRVSSSTVSVMAPSIPCALGGVCAIHHQHVLLAGIGRWPAAPVDLHRFAQRCPRQQGALDPRRVALHPLQRIQLLFQVTRRRLAIGHTLGELLAGG